MRSAAKPYVGHGTAAGGGGSGFCVVTYSVDVEPRSSAVWFTRWTMYAVERPADEDGQRGEDDQRATHAREGSRRALA